MRTLADFIACQASELALLPNATTALNNVIHSVALAENTHANKTNAIYFDISYGSVKKMIKKKYPGKAHEIHIPISSNEESMFFA